MLKKNNGYIPDVLDCLANLSSDEVFTPPEIANKMLDLLPQELFESTTTTFLDPFTKSGVFLREITKRLLKNRIHNYEELASEIDRIEKEAIQKSIKNKELDLNDSFYNEKAKKIGRTAIDNHEKSNEFIIFERNLQKELNRIFSTQVFGIAITELTAQLTRRSLYCSKNASGKYSVSTEFSNSDGNIRFKSMKHTWKNNNCIYCGANKNMFDRPDDFEQHAYEFIHTKNIKEIFNMKFDVIIGNPPYQMNDGGSGTGISSKPIYHHFVKQAKKLNPKYLTMIIPARWYAGGKGLEEFRSEMLNDKHITQLVDYPKSKECFNGVDIAGGVCYFLRDRDNEKICKIVSIQNKKETVSKRYLNEFDIFVRDNTGINIIHKILSKKEKMMNNIVFTRNPFGFISSERGNNINFKDSIKLISSAGTGYVKATDVSKNKDKINHYKVIIGKINPDRGGVNNASDGKMNVITKIKVIEPNTIFTETYLMLGAFKSKEEANNCASYFSCKLTRTLISLTLSSMNISTQNFQFVPIQDFSKPWTDEELYKKYNLTQDEIDFIESTIKPMENIINSEGDKNE